MTDTSRTTRRHSRGEWTDWNAHDPGVTLLELLAFGLEDLAGGVRRRLRSGDCGWRCALLIAVSTAGVVVLLHQSAAKGRRRDQRE